MNIAINKRPDNFDNYLGNESLLKIVKGFLNQEKHPQSYMIVGPHGCGKTTLARIMSKEFDCSDTNEINCSDKNRVDDIRDIIMEVPNRNLIGGKRVYILDEPHRLTKDAQNALLKTLEEPPSHVYFFLCTTDPQKLISTVKSRCTKLVVEKPEKKILKQYLASIAEEYDYTVKSKILKLICDKSECHIRDALKILEMLIIMGPDIDFEAQKKIVINAETSKEKTEIISVCRVLLHGSWKDMKEILLNIDTNINVEQSRLIVLSYFRKTLLNSNDPDRIIRILSWFVDDFFASGFTGFCIACYNAINE